MSPAASSRWCPTPEQLMILEEMYKSGIRTPNASQIQQITSHLSFYGKIEGKNVFYWFQNHKARDRQKLRRKISKQLQHQQQAYQQQHFQHYFDNTSSVVPSSVQQLTYFNNPSTSFLPQVGRIEDNGLSSQEVMKCTWKVDLPVEIDIMDQMRMFNHDWMMMVVDSSSSSPPPSSSSSSSSCCIRPQLKTLELFPIKDTSLKDDCNNTSLKPRGY